MMDPESREQRKGLSGSYGFPGGGESSVLPDVVYVLKVREVLIKSGYS